MCGNLGGGTADRSPESGCLVGSGKKRKQNEATKEAETPQAKKIKPQTPNTFPKRKKVSYHISFSGASF